MLLLLLFSLMVTIIMILLLLKACVVVSRTGRRTKKMWQNYVTLFVQRIGTYTHTHIRTRTHSDLNRCVKNIKYNKTIEWETVLVHVVASVVSIASLSRHRHDSRARSCVILITDDGWSSFNASSITRYVINFVLLHRRPSVSTESIILHLSRPSSPPPI